MLVLGSSEVELNRRTLGTDFAQSPIAKPVQGSQLYRDPIRIWHDASGHRGNGQHLVLSYQHGGVRKLVLGKHDTIAGKTA